MTFDYDQDSLITRAGSLHVGYDLQTGLEKSTTLGAVTTSTTHNPFAEPTASQVTGPTGALFAQTYTRDDLGRITTKTETTPSTTDSYNYSYNQSGRLVRVEKNNALLATYQYDQNGNRTNSTRQGLSSPVAATYDSQDRQLTHGPNAYTYTANGDL